MTSNIPDNNKDKKESDPLNEYVNKEFNKNKFIILLWIIGTTILFIVTSYLFRSFLDHLSILLNLIGALFLSKGVCRNPRVIVNMSRTKFGYNKDNADDLLKSSRDTQIGLFLICVSSLSLLLSLI